MKLISWNVNGLRAVIAKGGFLEYLEESSADIFCLQEIKLQEGQIDLNLEGYYTYWNYAVKKGYSGTAIFSKKEPLSVTYGLDIEEHDQATYYFRIRRFLYDNVIYTKFKTWIRTIRLQNEMGR